MMINAEPIEKINVLADILSDKIGSDNNHEGVFDKIQACIDNDLVQCIQNIDYEYKYDIADKLRLILLEMRLEAALPNICGKTIVCLWHSPSLCTPLNENSLFSGSYAAPQFNYPTLIINNDSNSINIINKNNITVEFTQRKYNVLHEIKEDDNIDTEILLNAACVNIISEYENIVFLYVPDSITADDLSGRAFLDMSDYIITENIDSSIMNYDNILDNELLLLKTENTTAKQKNSNAKIVDNIEDLKTKYLTVADKPCNNIDFSLYISSLFSRMLDFLYIQSNNLSKDIGNIGRELVFIKDENYSDIMSKMRSDSQSKLDIITDHIANVKKIRDDLCEYGLEFSSCIKIDISEYGNNKHYVSENILWKLFYCELLAEDLQQARKYISVDTYDVLNSLYTQISLDMINFAAIDKMLIQKDDRYIDEITHIKFRIAKKIGLNTDVMGKYVLKLHDIHLAEEYNSLGRYYESMGESGKALNTYLKQLNFGCISNNENLISNARKVLDEDKYLLLLKKLGDMFIPEANYALYKAEINKSGNTAIQYLKKATITGYLPALYTLSKSTYSDFIKSESKSEAEAKTISEYLQMLLERLQNADLEDSNISGESELHVENIKASIKLIKLYNGIMKYYTKDYRNSISILNGFNDDPNANYYLGIMYENGLGCHADLNKALKYHSKAAQLGNTLSQACCEKLQGKIQAKKEEQTSAYDESKNYKSSSEVIDSGSYSSGCFITTAVMQSLGSSDDCRELNIMRKFRDKYVLDNPQRGKFIREYYRIAPQIIKKIAKEDDIKSVYRSIWNGYLSRSVECLDKGDEKQAQDIYIQMVVNLSDKYNLALSKDIRESLALYPASDEEDKKC